MDKAITITKEQYKAIDAIIETRHFSDRFPFMVSSATKRTNETYQTTYGKTLYKTAEIYTLTIVDFEEWEEKLQNAFYRAEDGEQLTGRAGYWISIINTVSLFNKRSEITDIEINGNVVYRVKVVGKIGHQDFSTIEEARSVFASR